MPNPPKKTSSTKKGGGGNALTKQIGPLPAWGWGAAAIAAYVVWKRQTAASASATTDPSTVSATNFGAGYDLGYQSGQSSGGGGGGGSTSTPAPTPTPTPAPAPSGGPLGGGTPPGEGAVAQPTATAAVSGVQPVQLTQGQALPPATGTGHQYVTPDGYSFTYG